TPYSASKAGVISLTRSAAQALAADRITSNCVCPGAVDTAMWEQIDREWGALHGWGPREAWKRRIAGIPLGRPETPDDVAGVSAFALMYVALWALTGVPIYFASVALMAVAPATLAYTIAAVLIVAGVFQLSPLKQVCLRHCRSPLGFLLGHWRAGWRGAVSMGWMHALFCVGCCWALMIVLVVGGAMGLPWVLLIACVVAAEKILPRGELIARMTGVALALLGVAVAAEPGLAALLRAWAM